MCKKSKLIFEIALKMFREGLPAIFVNKVGELANKYEGVFDLMQMWDEENQDEKDNILVDFQDLIDDEESEPLCFKKYNNINVEKIDKLIMDLSMWKEYLKTCINNRNLSMEVLSIETGIPKIVLEKYLNNNMLLKSTMFYKICKVLNLTDLEYVYDYSRYFS